MRCYIKPKKSVAHGFLHKLFPSSHGLRGNSYWNALRSVAQGVTKCIVRVKINKQPEAENRISDGDLFFKPVLLRNVHEIT